VDLSRYSYAQLIFYWGFLAGREYWVLKMRTRAIADEGWKQSSPVCILLRDSQLANMLPSW